MSELRRVLLAAADALEGLEIVPGLALHAPRFGPPWPLDEVDTLRALFPRVPDAYASVLVEIGAIAAIDVAGGFASMTLARVRQSLQCDYAEALQKLDASGVPVDVLPIGTNGGGDFFVLACDDSGAWRRNAYMRSSPPVRVAASTEDFFVRLADDWRRHAAGDGPPYMTGH